MAAPGDLLDAHVRRRSEWLDACSQRLVEDRRLDAAFLYGSFGRGTPDAWSDVDVVVFVGDDALGDVVDERLTFVDLYGRVLYVLDSTWNAPIRGAQVNALYDIGSGLPLYVDWNFLPVELAARPAGTKLIFDRTPAGLAQFDGLFEAWATYERQPRPSVGEVSPEFVRHAHFGMVPIAAKFVARRRGDRLRALLAGIGGRDDAGSVSEEIAAVRERLRALETGQSPEAIKAIEALCAAAEQEATL